MFKAALRRILKVLWGSVRSLLPLPGKLGDPVTWLILFGMAGATVWDDAREWIKENPLMAACILLFVGAASYAYRLLSEIEGMKKFEIVGLACHGRIEDGVLKIKIEYSVRNSGVETEMYFPLMHVTRGPWFWRRELEGEIQHQEMSVSRMLSDGFHNLRPGRACKVRERSTIEASMWLYYRPNSEINSQRLQLEIGLELLGQGTFRAVAPVALSDSPRPPAPPAAPKASK